MSDLARFAEEHDATSKSVCTLEQHGDKVVMKIEAIAGPHDGDAFAMTWTLDGWENFLRTLLTFEVDLP